MMNYFLTLLAAILISVSIPWIVRYARRRKLHGRFNDGYLSGLAGLRTEDALSVPIGLLLMDCAEPAAAFVVGYSAAAQNNLDHHEALRLFREVWKEQSCKKLGMTLTRHLLDVRNAPATDSLHENLRFKMLDESRTLVDQRLTVSPRPTGSPA
ncbi:MAG: hypothetical protein ACR2P6_07710 [Gammaproteobacteria bacterium]